MPAKLPEVMKSLVIQQWLEGKPRDDIASENGLSTGAVTNIVNKWRRSLGFALSEELRELAVAIKKIGITTAQCVLGFRIASVMRKIGVDENGLENFISDIYNRCKNTGLSPENISSHIEDLLEFSKAEVPLSKIPNYIKQKADEKNKLEDEIEKLNVQKETLWVEKRDAESLRDTALEQQQMTVSELEWYSQLKDEFKRYSIPVEDISKFAKIASNLSEYGYDVGKVIEEYSDLEFLRSNIDILRKTGQSLENKIRGHQQQLSTLEALLSMHNQSLTRYQHLDTMGFGLKQLDFLWNTVNEIAFENEIPVGDAVNKFLLDVERQYDKKLGYESKVKSLRDEVGKLNQEQSRLRAELLLFPLIGPKLVKLTQSGVSEQDIINIATVFEKYVAGIDRQSFASELKTYGGLKSAIQKFTKELDTLRNEVGSLQTQKRDLNADNQIILSNVVDSRHAFDYMQGRVDSLRNEILGLVLIAAYITYSMNSQVEYLQNLKTNNVARGADEFVSLTRAYKGDEQVSIQEIKKDMLKAIEVMQGKLDADDGLTKVLSNARLALMDK